MNSLDFLKNFSKQAAKWVFFTDELQPHELEILRYQVKALKRELVVQEIKSEGPSADLEAQFTSLDFFSPAKVFYLHISSFSKWDALSEKRWERLKELSDSQGNWLLVSTDHPKKISDYSLLINNSPDLLRPHEWVSYFNQIFEAGLDEKRIQFLLSQVPDNFLDYLHWIQLWKLGGDDWAEHALAWGGAQASQRAPLNASTNPAYDWVDAALAGRKDTFLKLSHELVEMRGEDPLRLWGLLGKSIKINSQLGMGEQVLGEAPFLITKLKKIKYRPELLEWWCQCDLAMKSSRADVMGLWARLP